MVLLSFRGLQGGSSSRSHCKPESLGIDLKHQAVSVFLGRQRLLSFECTSGSPSVPSWGAGVKGRPSVVGFSVVGCLSMAAGGDGATLSAEGNSAGGSVEGIPEWAIGRGGGGSVAPKLLTLVLIHKQGRVLLGMKKRGFGKGFYNGFGGKVEKGETVDEAAARELQEEAGVTPVDMSERAILMFHFDNDPIAWEVHVYHVSEIVGDPCETEEMKPKWFAESEIPYETMWQDDILWYPEFLKGRHFKGSFYFENTTTLVAHSLQVIPSE